MDKTNDWKLELPMGGSDEKFPLEPPKGPRTTRERRVWLLWFFQWLDPEFTGEDFVRYQSDCEDLVCKRLATVGKELSEAELAFAVDAIVWHTFFYRQRAKAPPLWPFRDSRPAVSTEDGGVSPTLTAWKHNAAQKGNIGEQSQSAEDGLAQGQSGPSGLAGAEEPADQPTRTFGPTQFPRRTDAEPATHDPRPSEDHPQWGRMCMPS